MNEDELKEFLRNNLVIEIEYLNPYSDETKIGLRFKDESEYFTYDYPD